MKHYSCYTSPHHHHLFTSSIAVLAYNSIQLLLSCTNVNFFPLKCHIERDTQLTYSLGKVRQYEEAHCGDLGLQGEQGGERAGRGRAGREKSREGRKEDMMNEVTDPHYVQSMDKMCR